MDLRDIAKFNNAEGYCKKCHHPLDISGQCAVCAAPDDYMELVDQRDIDAMRYQLRKISWIVNKPRSMSNYPNETELWRSIVAEVQAVFLKPPNE